MAFVQPRDRVLEFSSSNSQTVFALSGAADASYNRFSAAMGVGDITIGGIIEDGTAFKSGVLTYSATNEVTVTTVLESKGTFSSSGTKRVFMGFPAKISKIPALPPQGKLTLASGVPTMRSTIAAATAVLYSNAGAGTVPVTPDSGVTFYDYAFSETTQNLSDTTKSPAAAVPNANYDLYGWMDSATFRVTRSDYWKRSATVTLTLANPCVVTWTGSDFADGVPIVFINSGGALPANIPAGTTLFVKRTGAIGTPTATFNVSLTVGGAAISTNGQSQSGTHTGTAGDDNGAVARAASGNCEIDFSKLYPLNKNAITNGPAGLAGVYLGTVRTNATGTVDWQFGGLAAGGLAGSFGVWNAFNRDSFDTFVGDNSAAGFYTLSTGAGIWRQAHASASYKISAIRGLDIDTIDAMTIMLAYASNVSNVALTGIGVNSITAAHANCLVGGNNGQPAFLTAVATYSGLMGLGWTYVAPLEQNFAAFSSLWNTGGSGAGGPQTGMKVKLWQ